MRRDMVFLGVVGFAASCGGRVDGEPAVTAVGAPVGDQVSVETGPDGGELASADGALRVVVPPGALGSVETLSLQPLENLAPGGRGDAWRLGPDGLPFSSPVELVFDTDLIDVSGTGPDVLGVAWQTADRTWEWLADPASSAGALTAETTHFTDFSLVAGAQLIPGSATVDVGQTVSLRLAVCYPPSVGDEDLEPLGYACDGEESDLAGLAVVDDWSVNGRSGGGAATGTVSGDGESAVYTAPAEVPSPDTVAVSAEVSTTSASKVLVVSNVKIRGGAGGWAGTVSFFDDALGVSDGEAQVTWTLRDEYSDKQVFVGTGTIGATIEIPDCEPVTVSAPIQTTTPSESWTQGAYLELYSPSAPNPNAYTFTMVGESVVSDLQCGVGSGSPYVLPDYELAGFLFVLGAPCPGTADFPVMTGGVMDGSYDCPSMSRKVSWTFQPTDGSTPAP